jgi:hypothetical protein
MRCRAPTPLAAIVAALLLLAPGGPRAEAASRKSVARAHFIRGERLYARERYADALLEFEAGYNVVPLPGFLVNIGQCRRRLGDPTMAREAYDKFLAQVPDSPLAPAVRRLVDELSVAPPPFDAVPPAPPARVEEPIAAPAASPDPRSVRVLVEPAGMATPPVVAVETTREVDRAPSPARAVKSQRRWWLWGGLAVATIAACALAIGSADGTTTTIHDGTIGTLRR